MDNSIAIAGSLYQLNIGADLSRDQRQALEAYFQRFASFPASSIAGSMAEQWLDQYRRLPEARRLLLVGSAPIAEIALAVGYGDPLHFSRRFRQLSGLSPRQYRQQQT